MNSFLIIHKVLPRLTLKEVKCTVEAFPLDGVPCLNQCFDINDISENAVGGVEYGCVGE
jgi:hypothetical protein